MMTSAAIMKRIKQLTEDRSYYENLEEASSTYIATANETPVIPEYDYKEVSNKIDELNREIRSYKNTLNVVNSSVMVKVPGSNEECGTVNDILLKMAQLNDRKDVLDSMRKKLPKRRIKATYSSGRDPEYEFINYDLDQVKKDFDEVSRKISTLQMALDNHNQTYMINTD